MVFYCQISEENREQDLWSLGIRNCYFRKLFHEKNAWSAEKIHHHTSVEIHMLLEGSQVYELEGKVWGLEAGQYLLIQPNVAHRILRSTEQTSKYAISFRVEKDSRLQLPEERSVLGQLTPRMLENIRFLVEEAKRSTENSAVLMGNCVLETILLLLRHSGAGEAPQRKPLAPNAALALAKQYILEHLEVGPRVEDVADYCYMSRKQLNRIFQWFEGVSVGEYIRSSRTKRIEELLADEKISLKEVSRRMHFSSEYYFNSYFKKNAGMPPGEYRKMMIDKS